jgi:hypothetical protein
MPSLPSEGMAVHAASHAACRQTKHSCQRLCRRSAVIGLGLGLGLVGSGAAESARLIKPCLAPRVDQVQSSAEPSACAFSDQLVRLCTEALGLELRRVRVRSHGC